MSCSIFFVIERYLGHVTLLSPEKLGLLHTLWSRFILNRSLLWTPKLHFFLFRWNKWSLPWLTEWASEQYCIRRISANSNVAFWLTTDHQIQSAGSSNIHLPLSILKLKQSINQSDRELLIFLWYNLEKSPISFLRLLRQKWDIHSFSNCNWIQ